jgi:hypothetical protein
MGMQCVQHLSLSSSSLLLLQLSLIRVSHGRHAVFCREQGHVCLRILLLFLLLLMTPWRRATKNARWGGVGCENRGKAVYMARQKEKVVAALEVSTAVKSTHPSADAATMGIQ